MLIRRVHTPRGLVVTAALVAVLVGGVGFTGWTWRHPQAFVEPGGWGTGFREATVGETFYVGMSYPRDRDGGHVTLHGGQADIVRGEADADVDLLVCTLDPDADVGAIGTYAGDSIRDDCSSLDPIEGKRLDLHDAPMRQQVVLAVTLTRPGTVKVAGIDLDYSDRWQRGTQRTGGTVVVSTGRSAGR